jgi:hypothetical protein
MNIEIPVLTSSGDISTSYRLLICSAISLWLMPHAYSDNILSSMPSPLRLYFGPLVYRCRSFKGERVVIAESAGLGVVHIGALPGMTFKRSPVFCISIVSVTRNPIISVSRLSRFAAFSARHFFSPPLRTPRGPASTNAL